MYTTYNTIEEALENAQYDTFSYEVITWMKEIGLVCGDMISKDHQKGKTNEITLPSGRRYYYTFSISKGGLYCFVEPTWVVLARDGYFRLNIYYTDDKKYLLIPTH